MISYDATTVKNKLGEVIEAARHEPVCVTKSGKGVVYILDASEYDRLRKVETNYWSQVIRDAEATGYIGVEKSAEFLKAKLALFQENPAM